MTVVLVLGSSLPLLYHNHTVTVLHTVTAMAVTPRLCVPPRALFAPSDQPPVTATAVTTRPSFCGLVARLPLS